MFSTCSIFLATRVNADFRPDSGGASGRNADTIGNANPCGHQSRALNSTSVALGVNLGEMVSLAPDLSAFTKLLGVDESTVNKMLASWGRIFSPRGLDAF
jgi:hypothetical protein